MGGLVLAETWGRVILSQNEGGGAGSERSTMSIYSQGSIVDLWKATLNFS